MEDAEEREPAEVPCGNCGHPIKVKVEGAPTSRGARILCIDDDRIVLGTYAKALERAGYRPLIALDGPTGIEIATRERPAVILLDVIMPTMHGLEVCQNLRADPTLKDTPIFLLTALEDMGLEGMARKAGATSIIRKPFGPEDIVRVIGEFLERKATSPKPQGRIASVD
jgi:CheY-like chemotaxis protein